MRLAVSLYSEIWEDFYENYGISKEDYLERYADDWSFLYIGILREFGVEATIYHFARDARRVEAHVHRPTGCAIKFIPSHRLHRSLNYLSYYTRWSGKHGPLRRLCFPLLSYASPLSFRFVRQLRRDRPDVLLQQDYEMGKFDSVALICAALGIPLVAFFTGGDSPRAQYEHVLRRRTMRIPRRVVCMTREERERVLDTYRLPAERVVYLPNPVNEEAFRPRSQVEAQRRLSLSPGRPYVLFIGRLHRQYKGLDVLVDAWSLVVREVPEARLVLVGRGQDEEWLHQEVAARGLPGILFRGWVNKDELPRYYNAADVLAISSNHEGLPLIVAEAMSSGLPVVSTDVGGIREIVVDGETGWLVPPGEPEALANRLVHLLRDPPQRAALGAQGRALVEAQLARAAIGRRLSQILSEAVGAAGHSVAQAR